MAQLERRYVENKKLLSVEAFADLVALAWAVPGPVACNVAIQLGYVLRGWVGACVAGVASVLPFFLAMTGLAIAYQQHALHLLLSPDLLPRFYIVLTCLIAVTLWRQSRSLLKEPSHQVVGALSCVLLWQFHVPAVFVGVLAGSFAYGWVTGPCAASQLSLPSLSTLEKAALAFFVVALVTFACVPLDYAAGLAVKTLRQMGASLSLFGGGFSAIPVLRSLFVTTPGGVSAGTFNTAFTLSALVPGPLLNVVPFLAVLQMGVVGAFSTTLAFFAPTGVLAVLAQKWRSALRQSARFEYALGFLRAATTAFLAETILRLLSHIPLTALDVALGIAGLVALGRFKVPVYWLYLAVAAGSLLL